MNALGESTESSVLGSQPVRNWTRSIWYRPTVSEDPELQSLQPDSTSRSTYNRDVATLSASFLLVFLAFNATQNLQSSINKVTKLHLMQATFNPGMKSEECSYEATGLCIDFKLPWSSALTSSF